MCDAFFWPLYNVKRQTTMSARGSSAHESISWFESILWSLREQLSHICDYSGHLIMSPPTPPTPASSGRTGYALRGAASGWNVNAPINHTDESTYHDSVSMIWVLVRVRVRTRYWRRILTQIGKTSVRWFYDVLSLITGGGALLVSTSSAPDRHFGSRRSELEPIEHTLLPISTSL